jgi:predicted Rossmann fold nucleotide-binding protein DprA/Smf involved in DNA uptake
MSTQSPESRLLALLCTPLPDSGEGLGSTAQPLSPKKWYLFRVAFEQSAFEQPDDLFSADAGAIIQHLNVSEPDAIHIRQRLDMGDQLDQELARLRELGIWMVTVADPDYPGRLVDQLLHQAPPILFGYGDPHALNHGGLAVVGPRHASESDLTYAWGLGEQCASENLQVISGGAKGIDQYAMGGALEAGGQALGVLGDSLEQRAVSPEIQYQVASGQLTLLSPYHPRVPFDVGRAMGRNKIIYALADWAVVVSCQPGKGGTWNGAITALRTTSIPVFVRAGDHMPDGNRQLLKKSAIELLEPPWANLANTLETLSADYRAKRDNADTQPGLFK